MNLQNEFLRGCLAETVKTEKWWCAYECFKTFLWFKVYVGYLNIRNHKELLKAKYLKCFQI